LGIIGYRRPELLATPEWLAENIARPGFQILDARWRPDGSGRRLYAAGHIPGATYVDWRTDLVEPDEDSNLLLLAGPHQFTAAMGRAGLGNGMVAVLYDDTGNSYAARAWWSLRVYGFDSTRILMGGLEGWRALAQPVSAALELRQPTTFTPRMESRLRLSAARSSRPARVGGHPASRRAGAFRVRRPRRNDTPAGPHPGSVQRSGGRHDRTADGTLPSGRGPLGAAAAGRRQRPAGA